MVRGSDAAGPYQRLTDWLTGNNLFRRVVATASLLGIDPGIMLAETDPNMNAARYAAAEVLYRQRQEAKK